MKRKAYIAADKEKPEFFWLTQKFQPYTKDFKLGLDEKFKDFIDPICGILRQNCLTSYYCTDILGRNTESIDPRLYYSNIKNGTNYYNFKYIYTMNSGEKDVTYTDSTDAGIDIHFNNIYGKQLWSWSPRNYCQLISYDRLQRETEVSVKKITGNDPVNSYDEFNLVEHTLYGETQPDAKDKNLCSKVYKLNDLYVLRK